MASNVRLPKEDLTRSGVNRRVVENLPAVRKCYGQGCGRLTRPTTIPAEQAPGAVVRRSAFYCGPCQRRFGDVRPAELAEEFAAIETPDVDRPVVTDEEVLHAAKGLNRFMMNRQQREHRRDRLATIQKPPYVRQKQVHQ
jgi:hypothetical protein